jgi:hypothetical protein
MNIQGGSLITPRPILAVVQVIGRGGPFNLSTTSSDLRRAGHGWRSHKFCTSPYISLVVLYTFPKVEIIQGGAHTNMTSSLMAKARRPRRRRRGAARGAPLPAQAGRGEAVIIGAGNVTHNHLQASISYMYYVHVIIQSVCRVADK